MTRRFDADYPVPGVIDAESVEAVRQEMPPDRLLEMFRYMKLQRAVEDRIVNLYKRGEIVGGVYTGHGHEAIGVGSAIQLDREDVVFPSHRDLGAFLIKGMKPSAIFAQYLGRIGGPTRGRDGNVHMGDWDLRIGAFVSHMADTVPVAAGVAHSFQYRGEPHVVLCYNGDGATSRGDWHEGLNLAAVLELPVVYICVNNQWAYSTPLNRQMAISKVSERAAAYGIPGTTVDGNDVLAVHRAVEKAIERARSGQGPSLVEAVTYRMTGHSHADSAEYVPDGFVEEGEEEDPIERFAAWLRTGGLIDGNEVEELERELDSEMDAAVEEALASPYPDGMETFEGVYANPLPGLVGG